MNKFIPKGSLQFIKYGIVGGVNFILSLMLFLILLKVLQIRYMIALTITWLFGILLTYVINFLWVFKPKERLEFKVQFPKYFIVYISSYLVNITILDFIVKKYSIDPFIAQFGILPIVICINFLGFKYWSLK